MTAAEAAAQTADAQAEYEAIAMCNEEIADVCRRHGMELIAVPCLIPIGGQTTGDPVMALMAKPTLRRKAIDPDG